MVCPGILGQHFHTHIPKAGERETQEVLGISTIMMTSEKKLVRGMPHQEGMKGPMQHPFAGGSADQHHRFCHSGSSLLPEQHRQASWQSAARVDSQHQDDICPLMSLVAMPAGLQADTDDLAGSLLNAYSEVGWKKWVNSLAMSKVYHLAGDVLQDRPGRTSQCAVFKSILAELAAGYLCRATCIAPANICKRLKDWLAELSNACYRSCKKIPCG